MIHSPNEVNQFLRTISNIVQDLSYEQVCQYCNKYLSSIPVSTITFENKMFEMGMGQRAYGGLNVLFRGRPIENPDNNPFQMVDEISFIGEDDLWRIKSYGRFNKAEESMFYTSVDFQTACFETISKGINISNPKSSMLTVGVWKIEQPLTLAQLPYSKKVWNDLYSKVSFKPEKIDEIHIKKHNDAIKESVKDDKAYEILQLFGDSAAKYDIQNERDYYLTNYYADIVFNRFKTRGHNKDIDGIIYPSVAGSFQESNIVLKPDVVKSGKVKFFHASYIWATIFPPPNLSIQFNPLEPRATADIEGNILWRQSPPYYRGV